MKKLCIVIAVSLLLSGCIQSSKNFDEANYYFAENQTSCAFIFYEVPEAPGLTIEGGAINHYFNEQNIIETSSPMHFGWNSEEGSGFHKVNYYKSDGSKIAEDEIAYTSGSFSNGDGKEYDFATLHFNNSEECLAEDSFENNDLFIQLIEQVYRENIE